ncbi:uncharacterized protein LOC131687914 [Topomyia yanbarensis]|uniref:uncharacterized protein LOC131687914 n=1 Tax=Topomyia yanbarensis TaxID=2498891 RepID=UPI00273A912E|nr:uncharacterized protein LOC131687914 [Topomyia yanbarensis]
MTDYKTGFMCLMTRPCEPLFYPKYGGQTYMALPEAYLTERYRPMADLIDQRFGSTSPNHITVKSVDLPDLGYAESIPRHCSFNFFSAGQRKIAGKLVEDFMKQPDPETLLSVASYARDRLNPTMFQYALSVALQHRHDTNGIPMPTLLEMFPLRFVDPLVVPRLREEGFVVTQSQRVAVDIPLHFTSSDVEPEQRLAYFREDIGVNLHHWHWHLVYPSEGPIEVVRKDRRGELFYYMHRQIVARYSTERYSNFLPKVVPLRNLREPIPEAYHPKILNSGTNVTYPARHKNMLLTHMNRPADGAVSTILEIENLIGRYIEAAKSGEVILPNGDKMLLEADTAIDVLGNILESSALSINIPYYGNIHSTIHDLIAFIHDPDNEYLEGPGVIGDLATALRDPIFYRLHWFVDDMFELHKKTLTPYSKQELGFPGVNVEDVSVHVTDGKAAINRLLTYWQRSQVDLAVGLDFGPEGNVVATFTHLQHAPFVYRINVTNDSQRVRRGTVRIFLAPIYDGTGELIAFDEQRRHVIELDKFVIDLNPGMNNITRASDDSSVTIPFERTFRRQDISTMPGTERYRFCNCGWPDHLLIPKGSLGGTPYELFVMVSDYEDDSVNLELNEFEDCNDSHSYCGLRDRLYPDRRAMGYPFDRSMDNDVTHMQQLVQQFSNMKRTVVEIRFTNTVIARKMSSSGNRKLLSLLQRPLEPTFYPKDNGKTVIDLPENYLTERYRPIGESLQNRFGSDADTRIPVRNVGTPSIGFAEAIDRRGGFSLFNEKHRKIAGELIAFFINQPDVESLMSVGAYARDRLNPMLFQYALSVAVQHRPDTKDLSIPSLLELFPDSFVDPAVFPRLREEGSVVQQENRMTIDIPMNFTASEREDEQRLAYFREDIGVNLHHWHWHLVYPGDGPDQVVRKDRRGELFYYMHQQLIARYNIERFCARLSRVQPLNNLRIPLTEGYFPKIIRSANSRAFPPRPQNQMLRDVNRVDDDVIFSVNDLERWGSRIAEAIDAGFVLGPNGQRIPLDETTGVDILGNIMEPSSLSVNRQYYGSYHGNLHNVIAYSHDPDNRFLEGYGVVGEFQTAMRDPSFYRLHCQVDNMFHRFKNTLQPYPTNQLNYNGIQIQSISAQLNRANAPNNVLLTYWQRSQVDLATGLDFGPQGNVFASFTHLQHAPFTYRLAVNNNSGAMRRGTCRIFIGPKVDERNTALTYQEQRILMTELDKFTVTLNPGVNNIVRRSEQSSVTIPYERTFRQVALSNQPGTEAFRFCNCGWPHHLLLPKGTPEGMKFDMFVMISDYTNDTVNQEFDENVNCNDSHSFCGLRDRLYPDRRAMGYPFDRRAATSVRTLQDFVAGNTNMALTTVQIRFTNTVIART